MGQILLYILATLFFFFGGFWVFRLSWDEIVGIKNQSDKRRSWLIIFEIATFSTISGLFWGAVMLLVGIGIPIFFIVAMFL